MFRSTVMHGKGVKKAQQNVRSGSTHIRLNFQRKKGLVELPFSQRPDLKERFVKTSIGYVIVRIN